MANIINPKNKVLKRGYHRMTLDFGNTYSDGSFHKGCDFTGNTSVDDGYDYVVAIADGVVTSCQNGIKGVIKDTGTAGMGNYVYIEHENGYRSRYQHMKHGMVTVRKGDKVKAGQVIGYIGNTGNSTGRHLHFDISAPGKVSGGRYVSSQDRTYFDPAPFITGTKTLYKQTVKPKKSVTEVAKEIVDGKNGWGTGATRKANLEKAGYNYNEVQAEVNKLLNNKVYFKKYEGKSTSIVDALDSIKVKSSFSYRKEIAKANGIKSYAGLPKQNQTMLSLLKQGKLIKP